MILTREELAQRALERQREQQRARSGSRNREFLCLLAGSVVVACGLWLVFAAKTRNLSIDHVVNLNQFTGPQELVPYLKMVPNGPDQDFIARQIYDAKRRGVHFDNDGGVARMRGERPPGHLLTAQQFAALKPSLIVRRPEEFRKSFWTWIALFFVPFYLVHAIWRARRFSGDNLLLPVAHVLCGIGLILMISLRDPLRDTLMFTDFAQGVAAGCLALCAFSFIDYERHFSRLSYVPLLLSFLLAIALGLFGSGPGASDAKVNLFFFQPVELIRLLIVLFLAGYFAQNWDALRQLRDQRSRMNMPRLDYVLPVVFGVAGSLLLFVLLSDLGPALVIGCLFLTLYSIARRKVGLAAAGLAVVVGGFVVGYAIGHPHTVSERVNMWRSPWDNHVHGGDQLADSLWALATGGATGTGLGLGNPEIVPAAHTDLVLSALGEQVGFLGIAAVFALYGLLIYRSLRIAIRAPASYSFFLVVGLALVFGFQILLIAGGLLGLIPLSGVVSPFLSYGRTSMVVNFAALGAILAISSRATGRGQEENFGVPARKLMALLAGLGLIVVTRAAYVQTVKANDLVVRGALVLQADGVRRYQYNPRLIEIARQIPKGSIFDRNGLPLATSDGKLLDQHRADYDRLGIHLDPAASHGESRQYPLGAPLFYLLGDTRSRLKQGASNTAFQESASRVRLQGYDDVEEVEEARDPQTGQITSRVKRDYRELVPLLRHRYEPGNPQVKEILSRPRDVHMSIDAPFELRVTGILKEHLAKLGKQRGAVVVMDPATGDLLAAVSLPLPSAEEFASLSASPEAPLPDQDLLDRARFGLYPPGSSFKIVTAIAALRKDPALAQQKFECIRLPDGRVGNYVGKRMIRDDIKDNAPHGSLDMARGIAVSCNAYFAQLGAERVGAQAIYDTAAALGISVARPNTAEQLKQFLAQASYGQGQVVASPFQMARVAATIANGGNAPQGRWIIDETNSRVRAPQPVLSRELAVEIGGFMRSVVTSGTARVLNNSKIPIAGKTGTAELAKDPSHAWFIGFAPYGTNAGKQIAFAVLVENGQYGGTSAAPIAGEIVAAARELGII